MAEPLSDFSKILELQEIKRLYDELQDKFRQEIGERDDEIARLRAEVRDAHPVSAGGETEQLRAENERLTKQIQLVRQEYEAKVERMNARLRELSSAGAQTPAGGSPEGDRKGFFRR